MAAKTKRAEGGTASRYECAHCAGRPVCTASMPDKSAPFGMWQCTRDAGHRGTHVAHNAAHEVKAMWTTTTTRCARGEEG